MGSHEIGNSQVAKPCFGIGDGAPQGGVGETKVSESIINLQDRICVITGAGGGQGQAHAQLFSSLGAKLVLTDIDIETVEDFSATLRTPCITIQHDVTVEAEWRKVILLAKEKFGGVDVLVNNAGVAPVAELQDLSQHQIHTMVNINLIGPILGMKAVTGPMRERGGGAIVNISSTSGKVGYPNRIVYSASKFGLRGATKSAAKELAQYGIRVNCVLPGAIDTPMISEETRAGEGFIQTIPIPRAGKPQEVANLVAFLASDASSYCTGHDFVVDGGAIA